MKSKSKFTYISLFSGAGIGCFGLKERGFECIATSELLKERIEIQKNNEKCLYNSGYVQGDILDEKIYRKLFDNINFWKINHKIDDVDLVIATPPCQGMSTANYKKNNEIKRNSLVVKAIDFIDESNPKIFVFENVKSFLKTICTDSDGVDKEINKAILDRLEKKYAIHSKIINFKNYGVPSSRPRTLVIGTRKDLINLSPLLLFPLPKKEIDLEKSILNLKRLEYGEFDKKDLFHFSRKYPIYMREWIKDLKPGENSFQHSKIKPYKIINGEKIKLKSEHLGNKFKRLDINKPAACINTRSDQLASQETIHPFDDRVLSIRELMILMTIPDSFKWTKEDVSSIVSEDEKERFLKKNELNIRRSIGEAVPTSIISEIAFEAYAILEFQKNFENTRINSDNHYIKSRRFEISLEQKSTGSYYTPNLVVFEAIKNLKNDSKKITVLEPAVGTGAFLIQLVRLFDYDQELEIDVVDINENVIEFIKNNISKKLYSPNIKLKFHNSDFLFLDLRKKYDLIVSNPPFIKLDGRRVAVYKKNIKSRNLFALFMEKFYKLSDEIITLAPKTFLMAGEFSDLRKIYENYNIQKITDIPVGTFKNVYIEIVILNFTKKNISHTIVTNFKENMTMILKKNYPYHTNAWLMYRNEWFDNFIKKIDLDSFTFYRDRQITNKFLKNKGKIWVLRSKNITNSGKIIHIKEYDKYIDSAEDFTAKKILNKNYFLFPNFTYNTRMALLPRNCLTNGSIVVLIPKENRYSENFDLNFFSSSDFKEYYAIVKNRSKFTINLDSSSINYIGGLKL